MRLLVGVRMGATDRGRVTITLCCSAGCAGLSAAADSLASHLPPPPAGSWSGCRALWLAAPPS